MKKTCEKCRAFTYRDALDFSCSLGYKQGAMKLAPGFARVYPVEECPKPKTYSECFELKER